MKHRASPAAFLILVILALLTIVPGCKRAGTSAHAKTRVSPLKCIQTGVASWYGATLKGQRTSSGEKYDPKALTAASRKYPSGTELNVVNLNNDKSVSVTVNDKGPYHDHRVIDMSVAAAHELGMKKSGVAPVCVLNAEESGKQ